MHTTPRTLHHRRAQRGGVLVIVALWMGVALACLLVLDIGHLFWQQRELQKTADMAALAGAAEEVGTACRADAAAPAGRNARDNGYAEGVGQSLQAQPGRWSPQAGAPAPFFVAGAAPFNACHVQVMHTVPYFFVWPAAAGSARTLHAQATAAQTPRVARLSVRSTLAAVDSSQSPLLNAVLGGLLGGSLNLSAAGWNGLLATQVDLLQFLDALALKLGVNAGDYDSLLTTDMALGVLLETLVEVLNHSSTASDGISALEGIQQALVTAPPMQLQLQQLVRLQSGLDRAALETSLNVFDLVQAAVQVGNGNRAVVAAVAIPLGIAKVAVHLQVLDPPQLTALGDPERAKQDPLGPDGLFVRTAQVRLLAQVDVPLVGAAMAAVNAVLKLVSPAIALLNLLTGNADGYADLELLPPPSRLDLSLELGGGAAYVTDYACQVGAKSLTTSVRTSLADIQLGRLGRDADEALRNAFSSRAPVAMGALPVLDVGCWGCEGAGKRTPQYFGGLGVAVNNSVAARQVDHWVLSQPPRTDEPPMWAGISTIDIVQSLTTTVRGLGVLQDLPAHPHASPGGIGAIFALLTDVTNALLALVSGLIAEVLAPLLDPLVSGVLRLLGVDLAITEVGGQLNCGGSAQLVY